VNDASSTEGFVVVALLKVGFYTSIKSPFSDINSCRPVPLRAGTHLGGHMLSLFQHSQLTQRRAANTAAMMILLYLIYVIIVVNHAGVNNRVLGFSLDSMPKRSTSNSKLQLTSVSDSAVNDSITDSTNTTQTILHHKRPRIPILSYQNNYVIVNASQFKITMG